MSDDTRSKPVEELEPKQVWQLFAGMAAVPRPSKKEERIREHVRRLAEGSGFGIKEDEAGNLVVKVPATRGHESAPITVLQGHLDMVCEKNAATEHDFENDPIRLVVDEEGGEPVVRAKGTTLGADNGIGVAMAFAAATSPDVARGPLELLLTADEEAGMTGAKALKPDFLEGKRMLNLDSEEDDVIYIGCAGGCDTTLTWEFQTEQAPKRDECCRVVVSGLQGGHSGGDIHLNRGNAIKLLVDTLRATREPSLQLVEIRGGRLRNVIPREASAVVVGSVGLAKLLKVAAERMQGDAVKANREADCSISVEPCSMPTTPVLSAEDSNRLLTAITVLPHGVLAVVPEIPGLVQTSSNVATVISEPGDAGTLKVTLGCLSRSSSAEQMHATARQIRAVGQLAGAAAETGNDYPGWEPDVDSPLLATARSIYEELFSEAPNVTAIHAGLECGIIGQRCKGMDMISIGPRIEGAHSPDERVYIESVQKSWKYLKRLLAALAGS